MTQRGRVSEAAKEMATIVTSPLDISRRPDPPPELNEREADEWVAIVNRLPADWITRETNVLLVQYVRHTIHTQNIGRLLDDCTSRLNNPDPKVEKSSVKEYGDLLKMQERESRILTSLATKMRISQQATLTKRADKGTAGVNKPWET